MKSVLIAMSIVFASTCYTAHAQDKEKPKAAEPVKVPRELLEKRVESARKIFDGKAAMFAQGVGQAAPLDFIVWSRRIMDAELALHSAAERPDKDARIKIYRRHLDLVRKIEDLLEQSFKAQKVMALDVEEATYHRLDAEILFVQAGGKLP